jgi:hypothetical protein
MIVSLMKATTTIQVGEMLCVGEECTPTQDKNCKIVGVLGYTIKNAHISILLEGYIDVPGVHQSMVYPPAIRNALTPGNRFMK